MSLMRTHTQANSSLTHGETHTHTHAIHTPHTHYTTSMAPEHSVCRQEAQKMVTTQPKPCPRPSAPPSTGTSGLFLNLSFHHNMG